MKIKALGIALMATAALVGCQEGNNDAAEPNNDNNVEQTRFNAGDAGNGDTANDVNDGENRQDFDMNAGDNENRGEDNGNKYDMSEEAAEKISQQVEGIDNAFVVTTENNAYVAAELDKKDNGNNNNANNTGNADGNNNTGNGNGDEITDETKQKISDIVKSMDDNIDNVYVSTNPDFLDSVTNYADQAENGEPIEGLFDQMGNMIERVFPQNNNN
ncbi:YhcN/YlaJ family sporulation lipoprotein [Virgibacillus necropolis]|uniref:Lipoprotein YhcN n=1 Tax=Virgibacillus necropolis TaxID=163877 RepID=A0A221MG31_9BACI|nr:YhcN/YlaJ family sporulation lipoprotein [Virgibacillus necropolis]ASN06623.1 hypothetical protein CFK40_17155 [Virgibacillus necropolis]